MNCDVRKEESTAEAREYRETMALEKMSPADREKYHLRKTDGNGDGEE